MQLRIVVCSTSGVSGKKTEVDIRFYGFELHFCSYCEHTAHCNKSRDLVDQ